MDEKKKRTQCKPIPMQDTGPKASQENPDQAVNFGPGFTSRKVQDNGAQHVPGITRTKSE